MSGKIHTFNDKSIDYEGLVVFWNQDPVQAALDLLGDEDFDLPPVQRAILRSRWTHRKQIDIMSRGTGKTFSDAVFAILYALLRPGERVGIVGPSYRQAKLVWAEIEKIYETSPILQECCEDRPKSTPEKCYLHFKAMPGRVGSIIEALPMGTDGSKIRGARYFCVIADELAQIDEQALDIVVGGFLSTKKDPMKSVKRMQKIREAEARGVPLEFDDDSVNRFIGSSTAYFQFNHLWRRCSEIIQDVWTKKQEIIRKNITASTSGEPQVDHSHLVAAGGMLHNNMIPARHLSNGKSALTCIPYWDMPEGFLDLEWIDMQRRTLPQHIFDMEFCAFFPPDSKGFFSRSIIDRARLHKRFSVVMNRQKGFRYVMGIDPARTIDNFAAAIMEVDPDMGVMRFIRMVTWNNSEFPKIHRDLRTLIKHYGIDYIKMDKGGGGLIMRDLFASQENCPVGLQLILEKDNPQHLLRRGNRHLAPLVDFSNYEWVKFANEGMLSALQHGTLEIAAPHPISTEVWGGPEADKADYEISQTLNELASIITSLHGNRIHWDTPQGSQRKDRYSAMLLGFDAARDVIGSVKHTGKLAVGGWLQ